MSTLGRMVVIIWLFVVLIINASYTASLTSILTVQPLSSTIKGIDSLKAGDEPIGYQVGSYADHYLADDVGISKSRLVDLGSPEKYAKDLQLGPENGGVAAIVDERRYVEIFLSAQCSFRIVVGQEFTRSGWGFAFPRDSPLATDLSTAILQLSENGDLQQIYDKWLVGRACSTDDTEIDSDRLRFKIFWGLFLICGIACIVALCIYFLQIMLQLRHSPPTAQPASSNGSSSVSRHLRRFISLIDEKEEQSDNSSKKRVEAQRSPEEDGLGRQLKRLQTETSQTSSQFSFRVQK